MVSPEFPPSEHSPPARLRLVSLCGTWLKPEMQSLYRQATNLRRYENVVFTEKLQHAEKFPFSPVVVMTRQPRPRPRGNFILRCWYKHIVRQWPPPREITTLPRPYYPYNLPDLLKEYSPALVHVYYGHKAVKYLDMLRAWGGPFLVSFHGVDVVKFTDDPAYVEKLRQVFGEAQLVLARSASLLEALKATGCPPEKLRLNHTPIPLDAFPPSLRRAPENGEWRLIQACRLIPKKGLFTTLEALTRVVPKFPKLRFIVCGSGPVKERFLETRDRLGLKENVEVIGWLDQPRLLDEYRRAHVFLHPSELTETSDQEGIPNSMLEAMATGLPVVATRHGGIPEAVTHECDGLLAPERDPEALAAALTRLLSDPALLESLSRRAAETVREKFSLPSCVAKLEDCYDETVALHRRAALAASGGNGASRR